MYNRAVLQENECLYNNLNYKSYAYACVANLHRGREREREEILFLPHNTHIIIHKNDGIILLSWSEKNSDKQSTIYRLMFLKTVCV